MGAMLDRPVAQFKVPRLDAYDVPSLQPCDFTPKITTPTGRRPPPSRPPPRDEARFERPFII